MSQFKQKKRIPTSSDSLLYFASPHMIGCCPPTLVSMTFLLHLLIQMLISSKDILIDTHRNNVFPAIWNPFAQSINT